MLKVAASCLSAFGSVGVGHPRFLGLGRKPQRGKGNLPCFRVGLRRAQEQRFGLPGEPRKMRPAFRRLLIQALTDGAFGIGNEAARKKARALGKPASAFKELTQRVSPELRCEL